MNESRFDRWTRRRFGAVTGGLVGSCLGLSKSEPAAAKKRRRKKRRKRCKKLGQVCQQNAKRKCCQGKLCADFDGQNFRCCKDLNQPCANGSECCGGFCIEDKCAVT